MEPENRIFLRHGDLIETPMRVISVVLGDGESVDGVWAEPIEGNPRAEDINLIPKPYTERDIIELACRAPAVPEWFEPDMSSCPYPNTSDYFTDETRMEGGIQIGNAVPKYEGARNDWNKSLKKHLEGEAIQTIIQWPRAYAKMVLEAR